MMKSSRLIEIGVLLCLFLLFHSCSNECSVSGIKVSELLSTSSKEKGINYCTLLDNAANGNEIAIREISLLEFNDATGYDQGEVIVDLILVLGEEKYIKSIASISKKEKILIESYIEIGFAYSEDPNLKNKKFDKVLPRVYSFLRD